VGGIFPPPSLSGDVFREIC